jgi:D-sedoheptulose 7-phosphate isomerase
MESTVFKLDPRFLNERCDRASVGAYLADYAEQLKSGLLSVEPDALQRALSVLQETAANGKRVYAVGNGGSAAIADHLCCDLTKGTHSTQHPVVDTRSLVSNVALFSAVANDFGFENVFSAQLRLFGGMGDVLIAVSSSGNSANIVNAIQMAHELGMVTIGLSGFSGGALKSVAQISLHVDVNNYGIVEDAHQALMHVLAQYICCDRDA